MKVRRFAESSEDLTGLEEDINLIKNCFQDLDESSNIDGFKINWYSSDFRDTGEEIEIIYKVKISFYKSTMSSRYFDGGYCISDDEVFDYWNLINDIFKRLKSEGFKSYISFYATNGVEMIILIKKSNIK